MEQRTRDWEFECRYREAREQLGERYVGAGPRPGGAITAWPALEESSAAASSRGPWTAMVPHRLGAEETDAAKKQKYDKGKGTPKGGQGDQW